MMKVTSKETPATSLQPKILLPILTDVFQYTLMCIKKFHGKIPCNKCISVEFKASREASHLRAWHGCVKPPSTNNLCVGHPTCYRESSL